MLPIARVVAPVTAARTEISDVGLDSLCQSIRDLGIQEPLIVRPFPGPDELYEVVAGHRRYLAAWRVGLFELPCMVEPDATRAAAIKIHENVEREELSAADEAVFFAELYEKLGQDVDQVVAAVRKSRDYVETRLNLLRGSAAVLEALRAGKIVFGVALELNRMTREEDRLYYLEYALKSGVSIRLVRVWRSEANARAELAAKAPAEQVAPIPQGGGAPGPVPSGPSYLSMAKPYELSTSQELRPCLFCGETHEEWKLFRKFVCAPCADRYARSLAAETR